MLFDYDDSREDSILEYAKKLVGHTFQDILDMYAISPQKKYINIYDSDDYIVEDSDNLLSEISYTPNPNAKGELGNLLEEYYFGYSPNSKQEADFEKVGIELKQTCIDIKKDKNYTAGERLSITNISYQEPIEDNFWKSHVWKKIERILLIHYIRDRETKRLEYRIFSVILFEPSKEDLLIIMQDYYKINKKIKAGLAHEISEGDTMYLGACTKGSTAEKSLVSQFYNPDIKAKKRNFCFKRSYMDYILHHQVLKGKSDDDSIIDDFGRLKQTSLEDIILEKTSTYIGSTDFNLCKMFGMSYTPENKALWINLAFRILGIKSNKAKEFIKADIVVKTIRLNKNNTIKESMSFSTFKFLTLINEEWETSDLCNYFSEKKFFFIVYKENDDGYYVLKGSKLWNMPYNDLHITLKKEWEQVKSQIKNITFSIKTLKSGKSIVYNSLLGEKESNIIHVRPKSNKSAYKLHCGFERNISMLEKDANLLPNGEWLTTQCFWLNKKYIFKHIESIIQVKINQ